MAVVSINEIAEGASGTWTNTWQRTYSRSFRVECDSNHDTEYTIRNATTTVVVNGHNKTVLWLPAIGSVFGLYGATIDAGSFVQSHSYRRTHGDMAKPGGRSTWEVTIEWGPYDSGLFGSDPTEWPTRVSFGAVKFERVVLFANPVGTAPPKPILNSAMAPFEDPVVIDDTRSQITVVRNERCRAIPASGNNPALPAFDLTLAAQYRDTVNTYTWNTFPPKCVKCTSITTGDEQFDSNSQTYFREVTYLFEVDRNTWKKSILDQGYSYIEAGSGNSVALTADDPHLLNGSGGLLAPSANPVYLYFDVYPDYDFSVFNIDFTTALGQ